MLRGNGSQERLKDEIEVVDKIVIVKKWVLNIEGILDKHEEMGEEGSKDIEKKHLGIEKKGTELATVTIARVIGGVIGGLIVGLIIWLWNCIFINLLNSWILQIDNWDWRGKFVNGINREKIQVMPPHRDQCDSTICWGIAPCHTITAGRVIRHRLPADILSCQHLYECAIPKTERDYEKCGLYGYQKVFDYVMKHGLCLEKDYRFLPGVTNKCNPEV